MHSIDAWRYAKRPNYDINIDKHFPYSEVPYIGQYYLVKIPLHDLIELVDYWGEGRIFTSDGVSGFTDCYNVNHHYQLVSNGPDRDRKIPNRVPVINYTNCDTSSYIRDNSVKIVTLMGAPINQSCAKDIARMVNEDVGKVVVYGFNDSSQDIKNLNVELRNRGLIACEGYILPGILQGLSLFDNYKAYLNLTDMNKELYKNVANGAYDVAVKMSKTLDSSLNGQVIVDVVTQLIKEEIKNVMSFAFKLWNGDAKEIVFNYFPKAFKLIFNEDSVRIVNKKNLMAIKLDVKKDSYNDRLGWGDKSDKSSSRVRWRTLPVWENNSVLFKIMHIDYGVFLKLDVNTDSYGDRQAWGSPLTNEIRYLWSLEPVNLNDELLFYIVNYEYNQGLKLDATADSYGDRLLWGHHGTVKNSPGYFGWFIEAW